MWPGFNYNSNFLIDSMRQTCFEQKRNITIYGVKYDKNDPVPNLVVFGPYSHQWKQIPSSIPKVYFSGENWPDINDDSIKLYLTSSRDEDDKHMRIPTWMTFIDWYSDSKELPEHCQDNPIRLPLHFAMEPHPIPFNQRKQFCGFVVSNPICTFRNDTFRAVNSYKPVNSGGALFNNIGGQLSLKYPGGGCGDISKHKFFSDHKFTISFENSQASGYITEKVLHAKMAGCVPIYWGDENTNSDFVEGSIVNISKMTNPQQVVSLIKTLETNPELCSKIASLPILDNNKKQNALSILTKMSNKLLDLAIPKTTIQKLPEGLSKIYLVNLDSRKDRLETLFKEEPYLENIITRISAVNGKTLKMNKIIYNLFSNNTFNWKKSAMGCSLSHMLIWTSIVKEEGKYFMVLEDDVRFNKNWLDNWSKYVNSIPEDADILYIGGVLPPNKPVFNSCLENENEYWAKIKPNTYFSRIPTPTFHFCTYSYIITKNGAQKMLDFLYNSEQKSYAPVDHLLISPHIGLTKYVSNPLICNCFQENDPAYINSQFNENKVNQFDSDICNNTECFTEDELLPFRENIKPLSIFHFNEDKKYESYEQQWLDQIFGQKVIFNPLPDIDFIPPNNSWFIVQRPHLGKFNTYFNYLHAKNVQFKVLHLSDEFGIDDISFYSLPNCKGIVRNYVRKDIINMVHVITVPLGYHYKAVNTKAFADRKLVWSFHGTDWFNRKDQLNNLFDILPHNCHLTPNWHHPTMTKEDKYLSTLSDSKFCPILRGNNIETFRMYECLEAGTIPIYVRTEGDDGFWEVISKKLGLVKLSSWENAIEFIKTLLSDTNRAEIYRQELITCWTSWKNEIKSSIQKLK